MGASRKISWTAAIRDMKRDREMPGDVSEAEVARRRQAHEADVARREAANREAAARTALETAAADRHAPTLMREAVRRAHALRAETPTLSWRNAMAMGLRATYAWADGARARVEARRAEDAAFVERSHARAAARRAEEAAKARATRARAKARAAAREAADGAAKAA